MILPCSVATCEKPICNKRGMCGMHYRRFMKWGDVNYTKIKLEYHGMNDAPEYKVWAGMKRRCLNKNDPSYAGYGAKGVTVCDEWVHSFQAFYDHIGERPSAEHSIDRIDNSKGYEPNNVRWATKLQQSINRTVKASNKSGQTGVTLFKPNGKWLAGITVDKRRVFLGYFDDMQDAIKARKQAEEKYFKPLLIN